MMKRVIYLVALLSLLGIAPAAWPERARLGCLFIAEAWAGAAEEIAAIGQQRGAAFEKGDADAFAADFADNAVYTSSLQPYRIEGKPAIKDFFATLFEIWATRHGAARGASTRVYANDTVVVSDGYTAINYTDKNGNHRLETFGSLLEFHRKLHQL
jgi:uncharacterized protein (TIGR02246 family)